MRPGLAIPKELSHLKIDERGYPIPFFVTMIGGKPEFRYIDAERTKMTAEKKLCHICGKKLNKDYCYFISGKIALSQRISMDAAMHRVCAEFSLMACPHIYYHKAQRRETDELGKLHASAPSPVIAEKPDAFFLIKASKYKLVFHAGEMYIRYTFHSAEKYIYQDNTLIKEL